MTEEVSNADNPQTGPLSVVPAVWEILTTHLTSMAIEMELYRKSHA